MRNGTLKVKKVRRYRAARYPSRHREAKRVESLGRRVLRGAAVPAVAWNGTTAAVVYEGLESGSDERLAFLPLDARGNPAAAERVAALGEKPLHERPLEEQFIIASLVYNSGILHTPGRWRMVRRFATGAWVFATSERNAERRWRLPVAPPSEVFWTMTSTLIWARASDAKTTEAMPGRSVTCRRVSLTSLRSWETPRTTSRSMASA